MPHSCIICGPVTGRSLFRIPRKPERKSEWLLRCNVVESDLPGDVRVCENHFTIEDFKTTTGIRKTLQKYAIPSVALSSFPSRSERRAKWLSACGIHPNEYKPTFRLCSNHFTEDDFKISKSKRSGNNLLLPGSVPSIFEDYNRPYSIEIEPDIIESDTLSLNEETNNNPSYALDIIIDPEAQDNNYSMNEEIHRPTTPVLLNMNSEVQVNEISTPTYWILPVLRPAPHIATESLARSIETESPARSMETGSPAKSIESPTHVDPEIEELNIRYPGHIGTPHFATSQTARKAHNFMRNALAKEKRTSRSLKKKLKRAMDKIRTLNAIIDDLKKSNPVTEGMTKQSKVRRPALIQCPKRTQSTDHGR